MTTYDEFAVPTDSLNAGAVFRESLLHKSTKVDILPYALQVIIRLPW